MLRVYCTSSAVGCLSRQRTADAVIIMAMRKVVLLLLLFLGLVTGCQSADRQGRVPSHSSDDPKVVCFFGGGSWRFERMTHFIPGFLAFDGDGNLAEWDLRETVREAHAHDVKVVISFDGEHWEENFLPMSDNADGSRDRFIANLVAFCQKQDIDGVDYDWEIGGGFSPEHQKLYSDLVVETVKVLRPLGLTVSIDAYFRDELNAEGIAAVDWLQLMSYVDMEEMLNMISYWESRGVPREKILIGMAAGWGPEGEGFDQELAAAKTSHAINGGFGGVMLFRTDLDGENQESMLASVDRIIRDRSE
ncbi:MAG: glycoside hydrolase family 18 protein [Phycisphaerales bacterium]|nr:glycoside hydrolase family 18 protein [Phycisphaerales bacterium]